MIKFRKIPVNYFLVNFHSASQQNFGQCSIISHKIHLHHFPNFPVVPHNKAKTNNQAKHFSLNFPILRPLSIQIFMRKKIDVNLQPVTVKHL